jgi:uncharacterized membrane protein
VAESCRSSRALALSGYIDVMMLRERLKKLTGDEWLACGTATVFIAWFALCALAGPHLLVVATWFLARPLLAVVVLVIAYRLVARPRRWRRLLPLTLVSGCLAVAIATPPRVMADLQLIARVYLAGGPDAVNDWGQGLIREREGVGGSRHIEYEELPSRIRSFHPSFVVVGDTHWNDLPAVRIELGGGFFHYGFVILPTGTGPETEWWQRVLGWPPELVVYHEE